MAAKNHRYLKHPNTARLGFRNDEESFFLVELYFLIHILWPRLSSRHTCGLFLFKFSCLVSASLTDAMLVSESMFYG